MVDKDKTKVIIKGGKFVALSFVTIVAYKVASLIAKAGYARGVEDARDDYSLYNEE